MLIRVVAQSPGGGSCLRTHTGGEAADCSLCGVAKSRVIEALRESRGCVFLCVFLCVCVCAVCVCECVCVCVCVCACVSV